MDLLEAELGELKKELKRRFDELRQEVKAFYHSPLREALIWIKDGDDFAKSCGPALE